MKSVFEWFVLPLFFMSVGFALSIIGGRTHDTHDYEDARFTTRSVMLIRQLRADRVKGDMFREYCFGVYPTRFEELHDEVCWEPASRNLWQPGWDH